MSNRRPYLVTIRGVTILVAAASAEQAETEAIDELLAAGILRKRPKLSAVKVEAVHQRRET